jgi:hypothetical protein
LLPTSRFVLLHHADRVVVDPRGRVAAILLLDHLNNLLVASCHAWHEAAIEALLAYKQPRRKPVLYNSRASAGRTGASWAAQPTNSRVGGPFVTTSRLSVTEMTFWRARHAPHA